jgi:hypothetical protein
MAITTALVLSAATAATKKIIDDLYQKAKEAGENALGKLRSDVKEVAISRALVEVTKVKTLWNVEKEVSLYEFYYPSTIEFSNESKKRVNGIRDFGSVGNFVIQGTAGQGKSIFLRFLCGQELRPEQSSSRIPIFIELRRIRGDLGINELIRQGLEKYKLPSTLSAWHFLAESGRFVLLLDAFDEIEPTLAERTISDIETIAGMFRERLQIIITSRPDSDIQKSSVFRVFKLAQLSKLDHAPFLKRVCADKDQSENLLKALNASSAEVAGLLTTPLMMTLLVILYKSLQTIPDTIPKFYEELFDVLFYRHDHSKPGFRRKRFTQLDDGSVKRLFSALCFFVRLQGLGVLSNEQLHDCCAKASIACSQPVDPDKFKLELVKTVCLLQEEGFEISFIHKSVAQYYAASFVSKSSDGFASTFYEMALNNQGWELELKFLSQIDSYRFNKLYQIPYINRAAAEYGISLDAPSPGDADKVSSFLLERIQLVLDGTGRREGKWGQFVGWSILGSTRGERRGARRENLKLLMFSEFTFFWIKPILDHLEKIKAPIPAVVKEETSVHGMIPINTFEDEIQSLSLSGANTIIDKLHARQKAAIEIIESEGRKTAMLTSFLESRKTN